MRGSMKITWRMVGAVAALAATTAGCGGGPTKVGSAVVVGDDRITTASLNKTVREWQREFRADPVANQMRDQPQSADQPMGEDGDLSESDMRIALAVLVNFRVGERVARDAGVTVTDGDVDRTVELLNRAGGAKSNTLANGLPARYSRDLARFLAGRTLVSQKLGADANPQSPATAQARQMYVQLFASTAKKMKIDVNPRYGTFDPARVTVAPAKYELSATESGTR